MALVDRDLIAAPDFRLFFRYNDANNRIQNVQWVNDRATPVTVFYKFVGDTEVTFVIPANNSGNRGFGFVTNVAEVDLDARLGRPGSVGIQIVDLEYLGALV